MWCLCDYPVRTLQLWASAAWGLGCQWTGNAWAASLTAKADATWRTWTANSHGNSSLRETGDHRDEEIRQRDRSVLCMIGSFFFFPSWAQTLLCRCILVERHFLYLLCISVFRHLTNTIVRFTTGYPEVTVGLTAHRIDRASCFTFTLRIEFIGILNFAGCLHGDVWKKKKRGKSWAFKAFSYYKPH